MKTIVLNDYWAVVQPDGVVSSERWSTFEYGGDAEKLALAAAAATGGEAKKFDAQKRFVNGKERGSAYIGGLGSGKTFAGIARGLKFSQQPVAEGSIGPRGVVAAISFPVLEDIVYPVFFEMMEGAGLWKTGKKETSWSESKRNAKLIANCKCADRHTCSHYALIRFRSLDNPNWMRGQELTWYFIDEGRHVTGQSWKVLWGRLRQKGYFTAGWVCSTPNGFDWMWEKFHPDSPLQLEGSNWYGASTFDNADNLPPEYIPGLFKEFEGAYLRQEVYGEFIGVTEGAVFFSFRPQVAITQVPYKEDLELFSMWDFGMGDLGVVSFGQVDWRPKKLPDGSTEHVPVARLIGSIESKDWTSQQWAHAFNRYCENRFGGRRPQLNVGDPAGRQRAPGKKTSVIQDLAEQGIIITTPSRKPQDYAVRILNNMMEADRVLVDQQHASRLGAAISSHHWKVDDNGIRQGTVAVHDWTSHYCDGLRYWADVMFSFHGRREPKLEKPPPGPGTVGYLFNQILDADPSDWLGSEKKNPVEEWEPGVVGWVDGRLVTVPE